MKTLTHFFRPILFILAILGLAAATFWLLAPPPQTAQTQSEATATLPPPASPTPLPTDTPLPDQPVRYTSTTLPPITYTVVATQPYHIVDAVIIPGPTYTPVPEPTPNSSILTLQSNDGYNFSPPRLVPGTLNQNIEFIDWLPNDPNKILIDKDNRLLEVIDISTGQVQSYSESIVISGSPVWLNTQQSIVFWTPSSDRSNWYLQMNNSSNLSPNLSSAFATKWVSPLAITPDQTGIMLFDTHWNLVSITAPTAQPELITDAFSAYAPEDNGHEQLYHAVQSPDYSKVVYFNDNHFLLADFTRDTFQKIDLAALQTENMPPIAWIDQMIWNPAHDSLAFSTAIARRGQRNSESHLFILDFTTNTLRHIEDNLTYPGSLAWAPDGSHLLLYSPVERLESGYGVVQLYLLNTNSNTIRHIDVLPPQPIRAAFEDLRWSPQGHAVAVIYKVDEAGQSGLYIIDVQ